MGQICCNPKSEEKKTVDVPPIENSYVEDASNNISKNCFTDSNAMIICCNKNTNDLNYNIKYKPKTKKSNHN